MRKNELFCFYACYILKIGKSPVEKKKFFKIQVNSNRFLIENENHKINS